MTPDELYTHIKMQVEVFGSQRALAEHYGVSVAYISEVLRRTREPGPKILRALGLQKIVQYEAVEAEVKAPEPPA